MYQMLSAVADVDSVVVDLVVVDIMPRSRAMAGGKLVSIDGETM